MSSPLWTVGHLTVDDVVYPDGRTEMGTIGGAALYAALGARYTGVTATVASRLGRGFPTTALDALGAAGIATALVAVETPAIQQWALYEADGSRRYVPHPYSGELDDLSPDPAAYRIPADAFVHVAPMPLAHQRRWCRALTGHRLTLDPHFDSCGDEPDAVLDLVPRVAAFLPSELEIQRLGLHDPVDAVRRFRAHGAPVAAVKLGADGCVLAAGNDIWHVPAYPVTVRDVTGAGDAFCGGFAAVLATGHDPLTAARWATAAASFVVETVGSGLGTGAPRFDETPDRAAAVVPVHLAGPSDPPTVRPDPRRNETV
jgi:ribokinase